MNWIKYLGLFLAFPAYSQDYQFYSYPCNPDSSECRGELIAKHFYANGDLIQIVHLGEENYTESFKYAQSQPISSELQNKEKSINIDYRYLQENGIPSLKFTSDSTKGLAPSSIQFINDSIGRCIEEIRIYEDSTQFNIFIRTQYLDHSKQLKTFLNSKREAVRIEEHSYDTLGLKEIVVRRVGEKIPYAWIRRVE
jgi:hypothetical protein